MGDSSLEHEFLEGLVRHYFGSMLVTDHLGKFLYVNDGCCKILGLSRETLLGISIYDTLHDYCYASSASTIKTLETRQECLSSHTIATTERNVLALSRPHFAENGDLKYVFTYTWDEEDLYGLLRKFDQERNNIKRVLHFMQGTDLVPNYLIAESDIMLNLLSYAGRIAMVDSTVIIYGESGSGKELFAKYIHSQSNRSAEVFIPINCAALPPALLETELFGYEKGTFTGGARDGKIGLFEFANTGTIFLDEIGEMPLELQAKLLRFLENGEIKRLGSNKIIKSDVRIITATNRDLLKMVEDNTFRADLYYRLNVLMITAPPLRARVDDIQPLAQHYVQLFNKKYGLNKLLAPELVRHLKAYSWPGNVRELKNLIERMVVSSDGDIISEAMFHYDAHTGAACDSARQALEMDTALPYQQALEQCERTYIQSVLQQQGGNVRAAATAMRLHISTLYRKMEKLEIPSTAP